MTETTPIAPKENNLLDILDELIETRSGQRDLVIKLMVNHTTRVKEIIEAKKSGEEPKYDFDELSEEYEKNLAFFQNEVVISDKLIDKTARDLSEHLLRTDTIRRSKGRPMGSVTDVRNFEIKLMYNALFYCATYENENGEIRSQYRH